MADDKERDADKRPEKLDADKQTLVKSLRDVVKKSTSAISENTRGKL